jgi:hypothetical protein
VNTSLTEKNFCERGAPTPRAATQRQRILELLQLRGSLGVSNLELYARPYLFGVSGRNRISELRKEGYAIKVERLPGGYAKYILLAHDPIPSAQLTLPVFDGVSGKDAVIA